MCLSSTCLEEHLGLRDTIWKEAGQNRTTKCTIIYTACNILLALLHQGGWDERNLWRWWGRREMPTGFQLKNLKNKRLWRPKVRRKYNTEMHFKEIEWEGLYYISLDKSNNKWHSVVKGVTNFRVQSNSEHLLTSWAIMSFLRELCSLDLVHRKNYKQSRPCMDKVTNINVQLHKCS
jgi:hypothetical protein